MICSNIIHSGDTINFLDEQYMESEKEEILANCDCKKIKEGLSEQE